MADPLLPFIKQDGEQPYLAGSRCAQCGHTYVGEREVCAQCTARDSMQPVQLADTGKVYVYTVVHRSYSGVRTPFVDVVVDLDDGAHLKGTLVDIDPDAVTFDLPVKVEFREDTPAGSDQPYLTYVFVPQKEVAA